MATQAVEAETVVDKAGAVNLNIPVGVPPGLQKLIPLSSVKIKQQFTALANKYDVWTEDEQHVFTAREDISLMGMMLGGNNRGFNMDLYDIQDNLIITLRRPHSFTAPKMDVTILGELTNIVRQEATFCKLVFTINDIHNTPVLRIKGPGAKFGCQDLKFNVLALDKSKVGSITKPRATFQPGSLRVEFPVDLAAKLKATIISSTIFIDYLLYVYNS